MNSPNGKILTELYHPIYIGMLRQFLVHPLPQPMGFYCNFWRAIQGNVSSLYPHESN